MTRLGIAYPDRYMSKWSNKKFRAVNNFLLELILTFVPPPGKLFQAGLNKHHEDQVLEAAVAKNNAVKEAVQMANKAASLQAQLEESNTQLEAIRASKKRGGGPNEDDPITKLVKILEQKDQQQSVDTCCKTVVDYCDKMLDSNKKMLDSRFESFQKSLNEVKIPTKKPEKEVVEKAIFNERGEKIVTVP